jgi:hypothetical protein
VTLSARWTKTQSDQMADRPPRLLDLFFETPARQSGWSGGRIEIGNSLFAALVSRWPLIRMASYWGCVS